MGILQIKIKVKIKDALLKVESGVAVIKKRTGVAMLIVLFFSVFLIFLGFALLIAKDEMKQEKGLPKEWGTSVVKQYEDGDGYQVGYEVFEGLDDVMEGDAMPDDYVEEDWTAGKEEQELFSVADTATTRGRLIELAEEYNEMIPYGYQGRSYSYGYFKQERYENILYDNCANGLGLDGIGYMIWLFRNALGHTPDELMGEFSVENLTHPIAVTDLKVGDICLTQQSDVDVDYGVVCGFVDGHAVVTMCDNVPSSKFDYGSNHLSYIRSECDQYLGNYQAVDFQYYYRLDEFMEEGSGGAK